LKSLNRVRGRLMVRQLRPKGQRNAMGTKVISIISLLGDAMKKAYLAVFIVFSLVVLCLLGPARILRAQGKSSLSIMPLPAHAVLGEGEFPIDGNFGIALKGYKEPRLEKAQQRFLDTFSSSQWFG